MHRRASQVRAFPATFPFVKGDQVFPNFITEHMPPGLSGLVVAAIFAAALSSSLNSIAATAINDLYKPFARELSDKQLVHLAGWLTVIVGIVQILVAIAFMKTGESRSISHSRSRRLINGPVLGVFLVGTFYETGTRNSRPDRNGGQYCADALHLTCVNGMFPDRRSRGPGTH